MNIPTFMTNKNSAATALITGASGGIGLEFAKLCAQDHYNLILVARSEKELEKIANELKKQYGIAVTIFVRDLSKLQSAEELVAMVEEKKLQIDILINNAGFGDFGFFKDTDWQKELDMINLNITTLTFLSKIFAKKMTAQGYGKILNVASTAAFQPGPLMAVYFATKAYVLSFSEAIANELSGTGVSVTVLCPGPTTSGFSKSAGMENSSLFAKKLPSAKSVAESGYRGLKNGKTLVIPGFKNKLLVQLLRFTPRFLVTNIVRKGQEISTSK